MTSMQRQLGKAPSLPEVEALLQKKIAENFA
jgi:hypothetical protein